MKTKILLFCFCVLVLLFTFRGYYNFVFQSCLTIKIYVLICIKVFIIIFLNKYKTGKYKDQKVYFLISFNQIVHGPFSSRICVFSFKWLKNKKIASLYEHVCLAVVNKSFATEGEPFSKWKAQFKLAVYEHLTIVQFFIEQLKASFVGVSYDDMAIKISHRFLIDKLAS